MRPAGHHTPVFTLQRRQLNRQPRALIEEVWRAVILNRISLSIKPRSSVIIVLTTFTALATFGMCVAVTGHAVVDVADAFFEVLAD
jgi:hypothetical protein